jgi:hypothetical protein
VVRILSSCCHFYDTRIFFPFRAVHFFLLGFDILTVLNVRSVTNALHDGSCTHTSQFEMNAVYLYTQHLVHCVRVMSVGCTPGLEFHPAAANWHNTHAVYQVPVV